MALALYKQGLDNVQEISIAALLFFIFAGYITGMTISGVSPVWDFLSIALLPKEILERLDGTVNVADPQPFKYRAFIEAVPQTIRWRFSIKRLVSRWQNVALNIDKVTEKNQLMERMLVKMMAEVTLVETLLSELLILAVIGVTTDKFYSPYQYWLLYIIVFIILFIGMVMRQGFFWQGCFWARVDMVSVSAPSTSSQ